MLSSVLDLRILLCCLHISFEDVDVVFLPPNTTSLIHPLDQGVIKKCKGLVHLRVGGESAHCNVLLLRFSWQPFQRCTVNCTVFSPTTVHSLYYILYSCTVHITQYSDVDMLFDIKRPQSTCLLLPQA